MTDGKTKRETTLYDPIARQLLARGHPGETVSLRSVIPSMLKAVIFPKTSAPKNKK